MASPNIPVALLCHRLQNIESHLHCRGIRFFIWESLLTKIKSSVKTKDSNPANNDEQVQVRDQVQGNNILQSPN
jgi:hypothetical protein